MTRRQISMKSRCCGKYPIIFIILLMVTCPRSYADHDGYRHAVYSHGGKYMVLSKGNYAGIYLYDVEADELRQLSDYNSGGYFAHFDKQGERLAFKLLREFNGHIYQAPVVYHISTAKLQFLSGFSRAVGVPSFADHELIAYTIGQNAYIVHSNGSVLHHIDLHHYVNLARISPDGKMLAYNDSDDQLHIYDLSTTNDTRISTGENGYYAPIWSPNSRRLVAKSLSSMIVTFDLQTGIMYEIGTGDSPNWLDDGQQIVFAEEGRNGDLELVSSRLCIANYDASDKRILLDESDLYRSPNYARDCKRLVYYVESTKTLHSHELFVKHDGLQVLVHEKTLHFPAAVENVKTLPEPEAYRSDSGSPERVIDAPYLHQVYDTPDWFYAGHSACGAASALMGIAFYHILEPWPCTCSSPYRHTSDYGRYVSDIYSFNGYTYNIRGYNSAGHSGYGAFGFIVQNNWANTREYMAMYFRQHGMGSSVDRSPTLGKIDAELESSHPFVILTSITDAGHYKLVVGHDINSHSIVVNDPYGNKNQGTYPNYNGKRVTYDWPGYNNGHENMNIVWCYIYMRYHIPDLAVSDFSLPDTVDVGDTIDLTNTLYNIGSQEAKSIQIAYYLSTNATFDDDDILLATAYLDALSAKDSTIINSMIQVPDSITSKRYGLGVLIDKEDLIPELSETNNLTYKTFIIKGYPEIFGLKPLPDSEVSPEDIMIAANFRDVVVDTDTGSLWLTLDGMRVTDEIEIGNGKIEYRPGELMVPGDHTVQVSVANKKGFRTNASWTFSVTGTAEVNEVNHQPATDFVLYQSYPNPFNSSCQIRYGLDRSSFVDVMIFSIDGKFVKHIVNEMQSPGIHSVSWDGTGEGGVPVASGIYIYRIITRSGILTRRLLFLK